MENQPVIQVILTRQTKKRPGHSSYLSQRMAFFNEDGTPVPPAPKVATTNSAIGTVGKSTPDAEPMANTMVPIRFTNGNSAAAPTLAFAGGPARPILLGGTAPTAAELVVAAGGVVMFWFDGTNLHQLGAIT